MPEGYSYTGGIGDLPGTGTQKNLHMIFVIDDSGSMRNAHRMDAVNAALQKMVPELQKIQQKVQGDFTIYLSIMTFDEDPQWIVEPTEIAYYVHSPIEASKYVTYYSRAFEELNRKLSRSAFMNQSGKMATPYIMLLTDGAPTPGDDYESALQKLEENGWFHAAQRYAVLIGEDAINDPDARNAVSNFVRSSKEGIIDAADAEAIVENVSAKTLVIVEQMTQHRGMAETKKTAPDPEPSPEPPFPEPPFPEPPFPDPSFPEPPFSDPNPGDDPYPPFEDPFPDGRDVF